jgi:hypothetical protein
VARYHKLLAYKDEYGSRPAPTAIRKKIADMFEGDYRTYYYLAPPLRRPTRHRRAAQKERWRMDFGFRVLRG